MAFTKILLCVYALNRGCENSLMIFIELHMHSSSEHAHILHDSKSMIVSPINVETTFLFVLKFVTSLLKLT